RRTISTIRSRRSLGRGIDGNRLRPTLDGRSVPCALWHKAETRFRSRPPEATNGCNISVSEASEFDQQCRDAIAFLRLHRPWLQRLAQYAVEHSCLDLSADIPDPDAHGRFYRFPSDLIRAAGAQGISIALSTYQIDLAERARKLAESDTMPA